MTTKDALKMAGLAIDGLEVIQKLTKIGGAKAEASLAAIDSLVTSLQGGLDGSVSPQAVLSQIEAEAEALHDSLGSNDAAFAAARAAKFPPAPLPVAKVVKP